MPGVLPGKKTVKPCPYKAKPAVVKISGGLGLVLPGRETGSWDNTR